MLERFKYRPDIDGLRGVAVLLVVIFHIFPEAIVGGFIGVDIFFVISGYLITSIIIKNLDCQSFSFTQFYLRRIKRIFPALVIVLLCSSLFSLFALYPIELLSFKKHLLGGVLFASNIISLYENSYFDIASQNKPLLHLWSLGIEEQFYLVWPFLLFLTFRKKVRFSFVILMLAITSFFLNICTVYGDNTVAFFSPLCRFWELMVGGFVASLEAKNGGGRNRFTCNLLSVTGAAFLFCSLAFVKDKSAFPGWLALLPTLGAAFVIAGGAESLLGRCLSHRGVVWIGLISYPLYLWHWPLISFYQTIYGAMPAYSERFGIVFFSLFLAWLTFLYIEQPIRYGVGRAASRHLIPVGLGMILAGFFGCSFYSSKSQPAGAQEILESGVKGETKKILLVGDSHADHLFAGLEVELGGISNQSYPGCIPFYTLDTYNTIYRKKGVCLRLVNNLYESIKKDKAIDTVVMSSMGAVYLSGEAFNGVGVERTLGLQLQLEDNHDISDRAKIYEIAMRKTLQLLVSLNKTVFFVIDVPEIGLDPRYCKQNYSVGGVENTPIIKRSYISDCTVSRDVYEARIKDYKQLTAKVLAEFPQVIVFDPTKYFCDEEKCQGIKDGKLLYRDGDHLSVDGSKYLAKYLAPVIREHLH